MKINKAYLMWVGAEHYATIQDYSTEAVTQGISKRMPNADVAAALLEEGTVVFLAHDEGEYSSCPDCLGEVECPECRKIGVQHDALMEKLVPMSDEEKDSKKGQRMLAKLNSLSDAMKNCAICGGKGTIQAGTGGTVEVDQQTWDYVKYNYWLHQEAFKNATERVGAKSMCEKCGGTGRLPQGKVFGLFIPGAIEYIMNANESKEVKEEMEKRGFNLVDQKVVELEPGRGCGKRHAGGLYVVTNPKDKEKLAKELVKELVKQGKISPEVEVNGNFIRFLNPVDISEKRFRGIKRWDLNPQAEDEAQMIMEGVE